jgi:hypothetical protein
MRVKGRCYLMTEPEKQRAFACFVRTLRGERSQRAFARLAGCSHTLVSDMEAGTVPKYQSLANVAESAGLDAAARQQLFHLAGYGEGVYAGGHGPCPHCGGRNLERERAAGEGPSPRKVS